MNSINGQTLEVVLVIFRRKYVKPDSQATAKQKWHRLIFDPNTMKLPDFLEKLNQEFLKISHCAEQNTKRGSLVCFRGSGRRCFCFGRP